MKTVENKEFYIVRGDRSGVFFGNIKTFDDFGCGVIISYAFKRNYFKENINSYFGCDRNFDCNCI